MDITTPPQDESGEGTVDDMLAQVWRQLTAFNELSQMLGSADSLDALVQILVEQLQHAIPNAQHGAVLLPDDRGELLLKAHWPPGDHSVSMTWIKRAYDRREYFIWAAPPERRLDSDTPQSAIYYSIQSAIYVPLLLGDEVLGVMCVDNRYSRDAFSATDLELMRAIANQVAMFVRDHVLRQDLQREGELRSHVYRQFPPKIAKRIFGKGGRLRIGGERVDPVTILVSDVRNFTALSAKMAPDHVVRMLNEMFDAFVPIIFEYDGVIDKYVGDSVLAVFGSPEKDEQQWEKAVRAALEMQQSVHKLGEGRRVRRLPVFDVGISVHTGEAIHGFIGSTERMEYTVIGNTVNQASRYCDGAGPGDIVISPKVFERVFRLVEVEPVVVRTKHPKIEPDLKAYRVKGLKKDM
jgi:adenylate cyclase